MFVNYPTFIRLYDESMQYDDIDMYIGERGWQDWMGDESNTEKVIEILQTIYDLSRMTFPEIRSLLGFSRAEMSRQYQIKIRTLESWDSEKDKKNIIDYAKGLLLYAIFCDLVFSEKGEDDE